MICELCVRAWVIAVGSRETNAQHLLIDIKWKAHRHITYLCWIHAQMPLGKSEWQGYVFQCRHRRGDIWGKVTGYNHKARARGRERKWDVFGWEGARRSNREKKTNSGQAEVND